MTDYSKGKIYKIVCNETGEEYYGSCVCPLCNRKSKHKDKSNNCVSQQIIQRGNWDIVLIEDFPCETKFQLHTRERYYIENFTCINKHIPARTEEQIKQYQKVYTAKWRDDNKDKIKEDKHNYNIANAEIISQKKKEYREANVELVKEQKAKYYLENKEVIDNKNAEYKDQHRDEMNKRARELYAEVKEERAKESRDKFANLTQEEKDEINRVRRAKAKAKRDAAT